MTGNKKSAIFIVLLLVPTIILAGWLMYERIYIFKTVRAHCGQYIGDEWMSCVIDLSLKERNAKYCWAGGIFSDYPSLCMEKFAEEATSKEMCETIFKPRYRMRCFERFP